MAFSEDGRLFVTVFGAGRRDGARLVRARSSTGWASTAGRRTNVAFGRRGEQRIYVVEDEKGTIEVHDVGVDGAGAL